MTTVGELAALLGGSVTGDESLPVFGVSSVEDAEPGTVVVAGNARYLAQAAESRAAVVVTDTDPNGCTKTIIRVDNAKRALLALLDYFQPETPFSTGIDRECYLGANFKAGANVSVGRGAYVGDDVVVGDNVTICPNAYIGDRVHLGSDVYIHPNVTVCPRTEIGNRVTIHAGSVIGADGFGYVFVDGKHRKVPQIGTVVIEDDVEIGACTTIDRAKFGATRIGRGTKIDNLVHIAHNCKIGENSLIIAQVGIAGSVTVGDGVVLAGQAGVKDHVTIGDNTIVAARSGVIGDVAPGTKVSGFPARGHQEHLKAQAVYYKLPDLLKSVRELEARVAALEARVSLNGDEVETGEE